MKARTIQLLMLLAFFASGQSPAQIKGLTCETSYTADFASNFSGGLKPGSVYLGKFDLCLDMISQDAGWWKGTSLRIHPVNTHGGKPSENLCGDFQGISNIEAGDLTYFHELWISQQLKHVIITAGLQDLNAEFAVSDIGSAFLNGSFGVHSTIADNIPSPIFPLTALGIQLNWKIDRQVSLKIAAFDGHPDDFRSNPYNTSWKLNREDGILSIAEIGYTYVIQKIRPGTFKIGAYFHDHQDIETEIPTPVTTANYGAYLVIDQLLFRNESGKTINLFTQFGISPQQRNDHCCYTGGGVHLKSFIKNRKQDETGLAVAHARFHNRSEKAETILEWFYKAEICPEFYIQPDFQYIINPSGTNTHLKNALAGILRMGIKF